MPFTLAHPAAVLPFRRVPLMATVPLVVGSLTPDLATYLPWRFAARFLHIWAPHTHSVVGTLVVDLPFGVILLLFLLAWRVPLTAPLWEPHRSFVRAALDKFLTLPRRWLIVPISLLVGSWTHILLDSFTHEDRFMVRNIPLLSTELLTDSDHPMSLYHFLQYFCSVLGLAVIAAWYLVSLRQSGRTGTGRLWRKFLLVGVILTSLLVGLVRLWVFPVPVVLLSVYQRFGLVLGTAMMCFAVLYVSAGFLIAQKRPDSGQR